MASGRKPDQNVAHGPEEKMNGSRRSPFSIRRCILHEDRDLLAIDKPAGLLSVPIPGSRVPNALDLLNAYLRPGRGEARIVNRIDRYTSGVLVFAKNPGSQARLIRQFRAHTPSRVYWALVRGHMDLPEGELQHDLRLVLRGFRQVVAGKGTEKATRAVARYRVLERLPETSLVEVRLVTGLKNQIRVQLCACGHPVVGDRHYAPAEEGETLIDRQALHSRSLGLLHPGTGRPVEFTAPPPADFARLLERLREGKSSPSASGPLLSASKRRRFP
jgi:23S rRNA pseudouridine1911/1915/1917 synthase